MFKYIAKVKKTPFNFNIPCHKIYFCVLFYYKCYAPSLQKKSNVKPGYYLASPNNEWNQVMSAEDMKLFVKKRKFCCLKIRCMTCMSIFHVNMIDLF